MSLIALVGGLMYAPANYDALAYRVPRVLHWLAAGQWHWIHTEFHRVNVRACGAEWLMAPLIAFTKSIRWIFLPDVISFLLLPGLLFSVFIRLGVRRKPAWNWMWILTTGYCFAMQAGGIANDLPGAIFALAAVDFGLRLRASQRPQNFWLFLLASALLTGAKASNIPLLLAPFILILPRWRILFVRPALNLLASIFAVMASNAPTAILNWKYCHDWTGMSLEGPMKGPLTQLTINAGNWLVLNFFPPIFPLAGKWTKFLEHTLGLSADPVRCLSVPPVALGEGECLGAGVSLLLLVAALASCAIRHRQGHHGVAKPAGAYWKLLLWSSWFALLVFGLKAQVVFSSSRLLTPYYALLIAPILVCHFDERVLRFRWWKCAVAAVFTLATLLEILIPDRPLWPAQTILGKLKASHPSSAFIAHAEAVYSVYRQRPKSFAPLVAELPADVKVVGLITFDTPEASLWWPLDSRRIEHVTREDTPETLAARGIKYILSPAYADEFSLSVEEAMQKYDVTVVRKLPLRLLAQHDPEDWYILETKRPAAPSPRP